MPDQIITNDNQVTLLTSIADTQEVTTLVSTTIDVDGNTTSTELTSSPEITVITSDASTSLTQLETGYVGGRGPQGIQGEIGPQGNRGDDGDDGFSAVTEQPTSPVHSDVWWDVATGILWAYYDPNLTGIGVWIEVGRPGPVSEELPPVGLEGDILTFTGGTPTWSAPVDELPPVGLEGDVLTVTGGTPTWSTPVVPVDELPPVGLEGDVLTVTGGTPTWSAPVEYQPTTTLTYNKAGVLTVAEGSARIYPPRNATISKWEAWAGAAPTGTNLVFAVKVNGVSSIVCTLPSGSNYAEGVTSTPLLTTDYITVDVTQIGSTFAGSDASIRLTGN